MLGHIVVSSGHEELLMSFREIDSKLEQVSYLRKEKWKISIKLKRYRQALSSQVGSDTTGSSTTMLSSKYGMAKRLPRGRPLKRPYQAIGNYNVYSIYPIVVLLYTSLCKENYI